MHMPLRPPRPPPSYHIRPSSSLSHTLTTKPSSSFSQTPLPYSRLNTGSLKWDRYAQTPPSNNNNNNPHDETQTVLPLWVADADFATSPAIIKALHTRTNHGVFGYTHAREVESAAVVKYLKSQSKEAAANSEIKPSTIVWLPGLVYGLALAARAFARPGETIMSCTPVYPPFFLAPTYSGRSVSTIPLIRSSPSSPYTFDFDAMKRRCDDMTKPPVRVFFLCNPHNPVGRVFTKSELFELFEFARRYDLVVISDEVHCDLILNDNTKHVSALEICGTKDAKVVVLNSPSKAYNIAGLCAAYAIVLNDELKHQLIRENRGGADVNTLGYVALGAAYEEGNEWRKGFIAHLANQRQLLHDLLQGSGIKFDTFEHHAATYLAWLDCSDVVNSHAFTTLLHQCRVALNDGVTFWGPEDVAKNTTAKQFVRINIACHEEVLREAVKRMQRLRYFSANNHT